MRRALWAFVVPALALSSALTLAACGNGQDSGTGSMSGMNHSTTNGKTPAGATGTPASGTHNQADVDFAASMIPHHRQAVAMAQMAASRATAPHVTDLAARIEAAQGPEIVRMSGWLTGWSQPVPTASSMEGMEGMDHGSDMGGMNGMMSDQDMTAMSKLDERVFDRAFLSGMITHHRGAVAMAKTELANGANAEAKQLAQAIIDGQTAEIDEMTALLSKAGS